MRQIFILVVIFSATIVYGKTPANKINEHENVSNELIENENTPIRVIYTDKERETKEPPAYFLNGQFINQFSMATVNPQMMDSIEVYSDSIQIDKVKYYGRIDIKTKSNYTPKLISLNALKEKYTDVKNRQVIFMINNEIIKADYENFMVDENYILQIIVDNVKIKKEAIDLTTINLRTKTKENIEKSKVIRIR